MVARIDDTPLSGSVCFLQAKLYGTCVASKLPEVEKGQCEKEFVALKACMQQSVGVLSTAKFV